MKKFSFFAFFLVAMIGFGLYKNSEKIALWFAIQSSQPEWVKKQLTADFSPFKKVTQQDLDATFEKAKHYQVVRYRLIDGKIFRQGEAHLLDRTRQFEKMLFRIQRSKKLPNLDCLICLGDGVPEAYVPHDFWITEHQAPLLAWAKKGDAPFVVLIPDILTTREASWHKEIEGINKKYRVTPWKKRKDMAFWRGASNDKGYTLENYATKPRYLISLLGKEHPHRINAGFCRIFPEEVEHILQHLIVGYASVKEHLDFKYLPVLDGYMCTFPGFQWRLLSGSLTFKQSSDEMQYFYAALKPYEHYVPISHDMSDLLEKIAWAKEHDSQCHLIAERARAFAQEHLLPNQIYAYLYWVLDTYSRFQDFDLTVEPLGPEWQEQFR
ncbi:MAG: hypothetical protein A3D96_05330 [Chlamydiae bacterium RIFCSPHIGHO2_12_FULL_44_59]|nr:MAG: hypothetical protein A2796_03010 [Chlamydiae bacterium RIFCSPHIGHO2_01_FULL_44_39]OGN60236.1 MAG: hypothetical protein A3D96_05330 [Chlamydiae bacterium RIFCSPHIGHO2_12_FULL_44_59]OGN67111.1 MAG: hypothetical protein A2978_00715 [Chlamydiae bacterium RIFCSPLOWO2_01_FULL_44_52]OGN67701.1 MAG: hypothetical protein A3I67_04650 [Chlamydiae bacterium RIFCSPLOWO2_02_FULL_45_22]OGN71404.1 MAG: hypothetical protein A3F79_03315 [Chlamydiae bacterium RIFCSPLOWO2_12_FULL_45_20]